jgi:hypothetical protein
VVKRSVGLAERKTAIVAMRAGDVMGEVERGPYVGEVLRRHLAGPWFRHGQWFCQ